MQQWSCDGTLEKVLATITEKLVKRRQLNMSGCCIDGKFVEAKKGTRVGKTKCGKATKLIAITEKQGRPIGVLICSISCHEMGLVEPELDTCFVNEIPTC